VVYAPVGRDATVAPSIDFKFRNTTDGPIYLSASVGSSRVHVTVFGRKIEGREIEIVSAGHSIIGSRTVEKPDENLAPGKRVVKQDGRAGHRITIYRVVKDYGRVTSRELVSNDYYAPETRIVAVPQTEEL
jgi:vancomycin resistance protein YoaR